MSTPLVSVVIPVYNTPLTLFEACINSIITQSYSNIEVLIVDDGSTDEFTEKIDNTASCDSRIKVFHKTNSGVSAARNFGIEESVGKYIIFVDADDIINKFWLEEAVILAETKLSDIVYGGVIMCEYAPDNQKKISPTYTVVEKENLWKVQSALLTGEFHELENLNHFDLGPCAKLFRKSCIDGCVFPIGVKISEDQVFNHAVLNNSNRCIVMDNEAYYYIYNNCSVSHSYHPDAVNVIEKAMLLLRQYIPDERNTNAFYYRVISDIHNAIQFAYFCDGKNKKNFIEKIRGVNYAKSRPIVAEALKSINIKEIDNIGWKFKILLLLLRYSTVLFVVLKKAYMLFKRYINKR